MGGKGKAEEKCFGRMARKMCGGSLQLVEKGVAKGVKRCLSGGEFWRLE